MYQQDSHVSLFDLGPTIDRRPLTVTPDRLLSDIIIMMGKARSSCVVPELNAATGASEVSESRSSCVLVVKGLQVVGIFTERDAVRAIASGQDLSTVSIAEVMQHPVVTLAQTADHTIFTALSLLRQHQIQHLPILDQQGHLQGIVTLQTIRQMLKLDELLKSLPLADIVTCPVVQAPQSASVLDVAQLLDQHAIDSIVLVEATAETAEHPVGMLTRRDVIQLRAYQSDLSHVPAAQVMQSPVLCFPSSQSILVAYWEMQQHRMRQFLVSDEPGQVLGMVTSTSFLQALSLEQMQQALETLQRSIDQFSAEKQESQWESSAQADSGLSPNSAELWEQLQCNRLLTAMALRIRESLDLSDILNTTVAEVRQFLQTERVIVYRFNPDLSGTVVVESVEAGWTPALNNTIQDMCFGKNFAHHYKNGRILVTEDVYTAGFTQCHIDILALYDIRASLVVPILQDDYLWGLLCAYHCSGPRYWRQFEVDLLQQLATHVAIAIQQSELYQKVQTELTERKRIEEQIKASLKEKEILLKEVHHRVKNNLQIISSLLRLQSDYIKDDAALASFRDSQNRIRSMSLIHEKLYQSKDLLRIDFSEYVEDLTTNLLRSYAAKVHTIMLNISADNVWLNIDTAIPCGLLINELVSNSLKHAFVQESENNEIFIRIHPVGDRTFEMIVGDNGVGFPKDLDFRNTESLGLQLVCTFIEQLEGSIELIEADGTVFKIKFAELDNAGRI